MTFREPTDATDQTIRPRSGKFAHFLKLYRLDPTFRGFFDVAVIGAIVLVFLHPPQLPDLFARTTGSFSSSQSTSSKQNDGPLASIKRAISTSGGKMQPIRFSTPNTKGSFERHLFDSSPPTLRTKLNEAAAAIEARRPQQSLSILAGADGNDRNVIFLRGFASLTLPGAMNRQTGERLLRKAADQGQRQANTLFGKLKIRPFPGVRQDTELGIFYLKQAAEAGDGYAAHYLSRSYMNGLTGSVDSATAIHYLRLAVDDNRPDAIFELAMAHQKGFGVAKDEDEFLRLLTQSANFGHAKAQVVLGLVYFAQYKEAFIPAIDPAVDQLAKAARSNNPEGLLWLGRIFTLFPDDAFYDASRGAKYIERCVALRFRDCFTDYGELLRTGKGVDLDPVWAYAHFDVARRLGDPRAKTAVKKLANTLNAEEIAKAQSLSKDLGRRKQRMGGSPLTPSSKIPTFSRVRPDR